MGENFAAPTTKRARTLVAAAVFDNQWQESGSLELDHQDRHFSLWGPQRTRLTYVTVHTAPRFCYCVNALVTFCGRLGKGEAPLGRSVCHAPL
jgi:hypothetical protein